MVQRRYSRPSELQPRDLLPGAGSNVHICDLGWKGEQDDGAKRIVDWWMEFPS